MNISREPTFGESLDFAIKSQFKYQAVLARRIGCMRPWINSLVNDTQATLGIDAATRVINAFPKGFRQPLIDAWWRDFGRPSDEALVTHRSRGEEIIAYLRSMPFQAAMGRLHIFRRSLTNLFENLSDRNDGGTVKFEVGKKLVEVFCYEGKPLQALGTVASLQKLAQKTGVPRYIAGAAWLKGIVRRYLPDHGQDGDEDSFIELECRLDQWVPQSKAEANEHAQVRLAGRRSRLVVAIDSEASPILVEDAYGAFEPYIESVECEDDYAVNKNVEACYLVETGKIAKAEKVIEESKKVQGQLKELHDVRVMVTEVKLLAADGQSYEAAEALYGALEIAEERGLYVFRDQLKRLEPRVLGDVEERKKGRIL